MRKDKEKFEDKPGEKEEIKAGDRMDGAARKLKLAIVMALINRSKAEDEEEEGASLWSS